VEHPRNAAVTDRYSTAHDELGPLPANIRVVGWIPLDDLLPTCTAIVYHGGAGTTLTDHRDVKRTTLSPATVP
jgi:UDP:flavonoid glycosyltransferase YjiC (YdhE family)